MQTSHGFFLLRFFMKYMITQAITPRIARITSPGAIMIIASKSPWQNEINASTLAFILFPSLSLKVGAGSSISSSSSSFSAKMTSRSVADTFE